MKKAYLENLSDEQLMEIVKFNNDIRSMLEEEYIEGEMDYVGDILNILDGKNYDIGFYNRNYWCSKRNKEAMKKIISATDSFGLCSEKEIKKVEYCIELMDRLYYMDYDNKQYDNLENKIEDLLNEIDDIVLNNLNRLTDDNCIDDDLLYECLVNLIDYEDETYFIIDDDLDTVYKNKVIAFN